MLPRLVIKGKTATLPIVQGGMGVGVSLHPLAGAVARQGGIGLLSSACLDRLVSRRLGRRVGTYEAVREEIAAAKSGGGLVGINIMVALGRDYEDSVRGAIDGGADLIVAGAGLPLSLPALQEPRETALVPIVSSARALELICRKWERLGFRPDAAVLEGPLAGGHLGFKPEEIEREECRLENLLPPVLETALRFGGFPVIAAGGIYTHEDILRFLAMGAAGVQMGTRFLATTESGASPAYKAAVVAAGPEDIMVAVSPGSPCGLPFRVIRRSPMFVSALARRRHPKCDKGYVLFKDHEGKFTRCLAKESNETSFCICNGLLSSGGYNTADEEELYTVGANAWRVDRILPVAQLMAELAGSPAV